MISLLRNAWRRSVCVRVGSQVRWNETDPGDGALTPDEYNKKYRQYQDELRAFRRKVRRELTEKKTANKKLQELDTDSLSDLEQERQKREASLQRQARHEINLLQIQEAKKLKKTEAFAKEAARREENLKAQDAKYADLLQQSRKWITEETLDERIRKALDHVKTLY